MVELTALAANPTPLPMKRGGGCGATSLLIRGVDTAEGV